MQDHNTYFEANKALWNAKTQIHINSEFYNHKQFLIDQNSLMPTEVNEMGDVSGKSLLHLQCHFGQDSISWAKKGAQVTAIDLSDEAIEEARKTAQQLNIQANFICSNVYDIDQHLTEQFDRVFTSYGTIGWLPDLNRWAELIAQFLKPGGSFYMIDFHPFVWTMDDNFENFGYSYFNDGVIEMEEEGTYADMSSNIKMKEYGWNHTTSDLLNSLLKQGLQLEFFNEFNFSHYNCFPNMIGLEKDKWQFEKWKGTIPYMYSLKVTKA